VASATILTIGNELVFGDVPNTNASWLAKQLAPLGVFVRLLAAVPDDMDQIADFVRVEAARSDFLLVTGGLGGTPDDITRESIALAFRLPQVEIAELADDLRARFTRAPEYAARWAQLPAGARPLANPLGGAPGFVVENVYVFPGLPTEMEAMFGEIADEFRSGRPIGTWRRAFRTRESTISPLLIEALNRHPGVLVGSYPSFQGDPQVEIVVKSSDADQLAAAVAWLEPELERLAG